MRLLRSYWYLEWLDHSSRIGDQSRAKFKLEYPFLDYAANNWHHHINQSPAGDSHITQNAYNLLNEEPLRLRALLEVTGRPERPYQTQGAIDDNNTIRPIKVAAELGLLRVVQDMIERGTDIESSDFRKYTPLIAAASAGKAQVVEALLQAGAKIDARDLWGSTAITVAARRNHSAVVQTLLEFDIKSHHLQKERVPETDQSVVVYLKDDPSWAFAVSMGHTQTVRVWLSYFDQATMYEALCKAWSSSSKDVAMVILREGNIDVYHRLKNRSLLYLAAKAGDVQSMSLLLDMGADIHQMSVDDSIARQCCSSHRHKSEFTPLHAFVQYITCRSYRDFKHLRDGIELLLEAGLDINSRSSNGWTALHILMKGPKNFAATDLAYQQIEKILLLMVDKGLSLTTLSSHKDNALHMAVHCSSEIANLLIDSGLNIDQMNAGNMTPIMEASRDGDIRLARILLDRGADPKVTDPRGDTLLHLIARRAKMKISSARHDYLELTAALIAAGADVNACNDQGDTALHLLDGDATFVSLFMENGFNLEAQNNLGQTVLFISMSGLGYQTYIDAGADIFTRDSRGRTLLHVIVEQGSGGTEKDVASLLRIFIGKGLNPHDSDNYGNSLWHVLAERSTQLSKNILQAMEFLKDICVLPTVVNYAGRTPLHTSVAVYLDFSAKNEMLNFLLQQEGVKVDATDNIGVRPLHLTAAGNLSLTVKLLELGADLTAAASDGQTPLMFACRMRQSDIVCRLLGFYKEQRKLFLVDQVDNLGRSALHYACRSGRPEIVSLLLGHGSNVHIRDKQGLTPLHACAEYLDESSLWEKSRFLPGIWKRREIKYYGPLDDGRPDSSYNLDTSFRVREIVRSLVAGRADMSFLAESQRQDAPFIDPLTVAIMRGCHTMIDELLAFKLEATTMTTDVDLFTFCKNWCGIADIPSNLMTLDNSSDMSNIVAGQIENKDEVAGLVQRLMDHDDEPGIEQLHRLGISLSKIPLDRKSPLHLMILNGWTGLMRKIGLAAIQAAAQDLSDQQLKTRLGVRKPRYLPLLGIAIDSKIPNLDMMKYLICELGVDLEEMYLKPNVRAQTRESHIHRLVRPIYWWHTKALELLLQSGCNVELLNSKGQNPLVLALTQQQVCQNIDYRSRVVELLLEHGANPHAVAKDGRSCLGMAADNPKCFALLLRHGAGPLLGHRPLLYDTILEQNLETLRLVINTGVDVNKRYQEEIIFNQDKINSYQAQLLRTTYPNILEQEGVEGDFRKLSTDVFVANAYPVHVAASHLFNKPELIGKATKLIEVLLEAGANPLLMYDGKISILHVLAEQGGILKPFLGLKSVDLETKDHLGRTLLLAACDRPVEFCDSKDVGIFASLLEKGASVTACDHYGRNLLHCLVNGHPKNLWFKRAAAFDHLTDTVLSTLVHDPDNQGRTAFHYLLSRSCFDLIDRFLGHGADPRVVDPVDYTSALHHLARELGNFRNISQFNTETLNNSSEAPARDPALHKTKNPPKLHVQQNQIENVDDLGSQRVVYLQSPALHFRNFLVQGLSINDRDQFGETPLLKLGNIGPGNWQWQKGTTLMTVIELFDSYGADFTARNAKGESVLHKLAMNVPSKRLDKHWIQYFSTDLQTVTSWLLRKGVDASWEDTRSRTCLDVAAASGAQWLLDMFKRE